MAHWLPVSAIYLLGVNFLTTLWISFSITSELPLNYTVKKLFFVLDDQFHLTQTTNLYFCVISFRDVKCILELEFVFKIHRLSLCEEFLVCASTTECQLVQLNFSPNICDESGSEQKDSSETAQLVQLSTGKNVDAALHASPTDWQYHIGHDARVNKDTNSSRKVNGTSTDQGVGCVVQSFFNSVDLRSCDSSNGRSSPFGRQTRLQDMFACSDLGLSQTSNECGELFVGPVKGSQAPCPVSVEFEGIGFVFGNVVISFLARDAFVRMNVMLLPWCPCIWDGHALWS